jgi:hypothetical protein
VLQECGTCGTRFAADLAACPHCWTPAGGPGPSGDDGQGDDDDDEDEEGDGVPKITRHGGVSFPAGHEPDSLHVHEGYGAEMHAIEHPADGTWSPPVSSEPEPDVQDAPQAVVTPEPARPAAARSAPPKAAPPLPPKAPKGGS